MPGRTSFIGSLLSVFGLGRRPVPRPSRKEAQRGPQIPAARYRGRPSYHRLARDLSRPSPAAHRDAKAGLLDRVPEEALPWLVAVLEDENLHALRAMIRAGRSEAEIEAAMIAASVAEQERQEAEEERKRRKKKKGGAASADHRPGSDWKP